MIQLLIIADDLTGANDTAVQFAKKGVKTFVTIDLDIDFQLLDPQVEVLAVDTQSRHIAIKDAAQCVWKIAKRAKEHGVKYFYKKTDSTLRGNIGAEFTALMGAAASNRLIFVPGYPKADRFTRKGFQFVGKEMVHESSFGKDPLEPVKTSFVPDVIAMQSKIETVLVPPDAKKASTIFANNPKGIFIFDSQTDEDLQKIGKILEDNNLLSVSGGPAGFAEVLADLLPLTKRKVMDCSNRKPILIVNGSVNDTALKQVAFAIKNGFVDVPVPPQLLFNVMGISSHDAVRKAVTAAAGGKDVIVRTVLQRNELDDYIAKSGLGKTSSNEACLLAAKNMGRIIANILNAGKFGNCVVFGGDTAVGVLKAVGCKGLLLCDEIAPGLSVARITDFGSPINFITKSGGFGSEDIAAKIAGFLRKNL